MDHARQPLLPFIVAFVAVAFLSLMDALMKEASLAAGAYSATLLRSLLSACITTPIWLAQRPHWPSAPVLRLHLERGVISALMALSFFYALTKLPLAEAIALSFVAPLIALYFARLMLGENITANAFGASLLGFAGTMVIVWGRLGSGDFGEDTALGLASLAFSALLYAYNFIVIRKQAQVAGPLEVATFHGLVSSLVLVLPAPWLLAQPQSGALGLIAMSAALSVLAAMAMTWAYARAETQLLMPLEYSAFGWAALLGWLMFAEPVTPSTLAGVAIIVLACWIAAPRAKRVPTTETANI